MRQRPWPALRLVLALVLGACVALFSGVWTVAVYWVGPEPVELGFDSAYDGHEHSLIVTVVRPRSPAEQAGLQPGDRMAAIDGERFESAETQSAVWRRHKPGDRVQLTIVRPGVAGQVLLHGAFRAAQAGGMSEVVSATLGSLIAVPFVVVGLTVLFLRLEDPHAWLLALLFASFVTVPRVPTNYLGIAPVLRTFVRAYVAVFLGELGALFYFFFAVFPVRSPIDRRLPWLKWVGVATGLAFALPGLTTGQLVTPPLPWRMPQAFESQAALVYELGFLSLGFLSLVWNYVGSHDNDARRKLRVILWGAIAGVAPGLVYRILQDLGGILPASGAAGTILGLATVLLPLSFAYAVVKHRVLEVPALIRQSARYLLVQRGFTALLTLLSIGVTLSLAATIGPYLQPRLALTAPGEIALGAAFGTLLLWGGLNVHRRVSSRIDRAFFRSAYDARVILEDLAERLRAADDRGEIAALLARHVRDALQPERVVVYIEDGSGRLHTDDTDIVPALRTLDSTFPALQAVAAFARPVDLGARDAQASGEEVALFAALGAECLVPMVGREGRLSGLVALGPRRSEAPYAGEDRRLLASVAAQAAAALDNIRLAEEIATRLDAERRTAREMEIASEVQRKLLPDSAPVMRTLTCAARCIQARSVGGDCYDYLDFGRGLVGLVLADVSGKGVHAALLMANLQAHLRSQSSTTPDDPARVLHEVNRLLWASTATQHYATLFFGVYDDGRRRLRYVNCGHNPPVLLRASGDVERLPPTAPAIGLFERWECSVGEVTLATGDVLAVFSDGVTDAPSKELEFGEERLIAELCAVRDGDVVAIVDRILSAVQRSSGQTQFDDLTLLVARSI